MKKRINDNEFDPKTLHFNSIVKTVINQRYHLNDSFEEILNLLDIWINEGSGWVIDEIKGLYINISNYEPLLGGSYISLPKALNNSMKGLLNLKNKDRKGFNRLMFSRTKHKDKKHYCMSFLQNFTTEEILSNHK